MAKAITLNDIMRKLDDIDQSIAQMQFDIDCMWEDNHNPTKRKPPRKAKDIPIGTTVIYRGTLYDVVGHGRHSDNVVLLEDVNGDFVTNVNCEDVKITSGKA